jgi:hypothetical protein
MLTVTLRNPTRSWPAYGIRGDSASSRLRVGLGGVKDRGIALKPRFNQPGLMKTPARRGRWATRVIGLAAAVAALLAGCSGEYDACHKACAPVPVAAYIDAIGYCRCASGTSADGGQR